MKQIEEMLIEHHIRRNTLNNAQKLVFKGINDQDVYNTSVCFELNGQAMIAGRVENRNSEISETRLFTRTGENTFEVLEGFSLPLQDPFITVVDQDKIILGGVRVDWTSPQKPIWKTEFYRLFNDFETKPIFSGPKKMKDIRLLQLSDKRILMLTRPQGGNAKFGKIGLLIKDNLSKFKEDDILNAPLLKNNFDDQTWGGANQIIQISSNVVKVIGHIAEMKDDERHYYSLSFYIDLLDRRIFDEHIIVERQDLVAGPSKRDDLSDVVFTSGINIDSSGHHWLLCGTSDCEEQKIEFVE